MPTYSQYVSNTPDNETIVITSGKLKANVDKSLVYGTYGGETNKLISQLVPIGAILAWAKSITGVPALPSNFVECNGAVLSDAASLLNGQTMPNLNGNSDDTSLFLRGAATSGGTGGTSTHTQSYGTKSYQSGGGTLTEGYPPANHIPPYYQVVFIIRVK